ncbi:hypothetical protein C1645_790200, partial [Glomus cerebriforme]
LNHGLYLDGYSIKPSKEAILFEDGELNISLYKEQPVVYTFINDHKSHTNLLSFNSENNNIFIRLNQTLQPSDICINFPIAEISYNADLLESFSNFMGDEETLYEIYGHFFMRKVLIGGKLFINFKSAASKQIDSFISLLIWTYNSAKYNKENPFNNLSALSFFPNIKTLKGEVLNTPDKLANWMNDLYQKNIADVISYNNLVPISELRFSTSPEDTFHEKQPGVFNFKERLSLKEWVGDSIYVNLVKWVKEFRLLQGLMINKYLELENNKKIAIDFINIPNVESSNKTYLEMIKPINKLEELLLSNNMHLDESFKNAIRSSYGNKSHSRLDIIKPRTYLKELSSSNNMHLDNSLPDIKGDYTHFRVKCERYKISLNKDDIKSSEEFKLAIEKALESMKPFINLQNVFDEYGYFFPLSIVLGNSLKNILPNSSFSDTFKRIDLESPFESLKSYLNNLNIIYLLTQKGDVIKENDLFNWVQNTNNDLEIIELKNIISLYDILEVEQQKKTNIILKMQDDFKVIMTGIVDLEDLDINNTEHYKRIDVVPSLEDEDYEVFGSIISKNNLKLEEFLVTFGLYDFNGFSAMINKLSETEVNIKDCYILWIIIGIPSKLSVFSPKNREFKVDYFKKSILLQPNQEKYHIDSPFPLFPKYSNIFFNAHSANYELKNAIKLVNWSYNSVDIEIVKSNSVPNITIESDDDNIQLTTNIEIVICILSSYNKNLKVDNKEDVEYTLDLIGYNLSNNNGQAVNEWISKSHIKIYKHYHRLEECGTNRLRISGDVSSPTIDYYDQEFKIDFKIDTGRSSSIHIAYWKNTSTVFVIKKFFNNYPTEEIINEVSYLYI